MTQPTADDDRPDRRVSDASVAGSRRGRPSLEDERTGQIVDAFVSLVAARGLEGVTLGDVAERAGVKRPTIRHYIGNRSDLVRAAFTTIKQRYDDRAVENLGTEPPIDAVVAYLFGDSYTAGSVDDDLAYACLLVEAQRDADLGDTMRRSYQTTIDRIAEATLRERPDLLRREAEALAYQVLCIAEFNVDLQRLGFHREWGGAASGTATWILRNGRAPLD